MTARRRSICAILAFGLLLAACGGVRPHDGHLIAEFKTHRTSYQEVVKTFLAAQLHRFELLSDGSHEYRPGIAFDAASLDKILRANLRVQLVSAYFLRGTYDTINEVAFFNFRHGMVFAGEHKGIVYVIDESNLENVIASLDSLDRTDPGVYRKRFYRYVEPHWYLFYEYFP